MSIEIISSGPGQGISPESFHNDVVVTEGLDVGGLREVASGKDILALFIAVPIVFYALKVLFEPREG